MNKLITNHLYYPKLIITGILFFILTSQSYIAGNNDTTTALIDSKSKLTVMNVKLALIENEVQHPDIVLRQAILETGWFKCTSCSLTRNNIFGFWYKKRYLEFDHWTDCIAYYKRWQDRHYDGGDYYAFLKKVGFATSQTYIQKLKSIKGI